MRPKVSKSEYLLTVDLPDEVQKKFRSRFRGAEEVTWEKQDTVYIGSFIYREMPTTAEFSVNGMWIETVQEQDAKDLYNPIQRNLDENHSDYRASYVEKVTRHDRDDYYYVELISKRKSIQPRHKALYFDKMGRFKGEE